MNIVSSYYKQENIYDNTCVLVFDLEKSTGKYLSLQTVCNMFGVAGQRKLMAGY